VSGGEPMLDDNCINFLENLPFDPTRKLSIITNLSYGNSVLNKLLKIIKKHPTIKIYVSLDAIGENLSRKYLNWDLWKSNFDVLINELYTRRQLYPGALINIKPTINSLTYNKTQEIVDFVLQHKKLGNTGLTFRFGTPFRHEMTSMWSADIDKSAKILLSETDMQILSDVEKQHITMFNNMIENAVTDQVLAVQTKKYIAIYRSE
jgi:wyosine [tRNA(Phe)-imidazoG37] synthetase (radical SAM superfamily)